MENMKISKAKPARTNEVENKTFRIQRFRHYSADVSNASMNSNLDMIRNELYPRLKIEPKFSNPLTNLNKVAEKKLGFVGLMESIEGRLVEHYLKLESIEIPNCILKKFLLN